jgi:hypothetical protein
VLQDYFFLDHSRLAIGLKSAEQVQAAFGKSVLLVCRPSVLQTFIDMCGRLEKSYFVLDCQTGHFKGKGRALSSQVGGIDFLLIDSDSVTQGLSSVLLDLAHLLSFCYFDSSLENEVLLGMSSTLKTTNPKLRMIYSFSGGKNLFQRMSFVLKSIKFESQETLNFCLQKNVNFSTIVSQEKVRSMIGFSQERLDALRRSEYQGKGNSFTFTKENTILVISDSKKTRESVLAACQEQGFPVSSRAEIPKEAELTTAVPSDEPSLLVINSYPQTDKTVSQIEVSSRLLLISPKSVDHLFSALVPWPCSETRLVTSGKDYFLQRGKHLNKFIDPVGLLKLLRQFKKNCGKQGLFKLHLNDALNLLGSSERSSLTWVIEELLRLGTISYVGSVPTLIHAEIANQNTSRNQNHLIRDIVSRFQLICGKYKVHPLALINLDHIIAEKLKTEPVSTLTRSDFSQLVFLIENLHNQFLGLKAQNLMNFEVKDHMIFVELSGQLSEIDIQRIIHRSSLQERLALNNVRTDDPA